MEYLYGQDRRQPRVSSVEIRPDYYLLLTFPNGEQRLFDVSILLNLSAYHTIIDVFSSAHVEFETVVWLGDIDISPKKYICGLFQLNMTQKHEASPITLVHRKQQVKPGPAPDIRKYFAKG